MNILKIRNLVFILFCSLGTITSCSDKDDNIEEVEILNGSWNLSSVSGGFSINSDFAPGEVVWTFNTESSQLIVLNNFNSQESQESYSGLESGTYRYELVKSEEIETLYVEGEEIGIVDVQPNILKIDTGQPSDGILMEFKK